MNPLIEPRHDLSPVQIDALENRLYEFNRAATGCDDGAGMAFVIRDDAGELAAATAGFSWGGIAEIKQMWVADTFRGRGLGRALLDAMIEEAGRRNVSRIWVASYDFQAPGFYERAGFVRRAAFEGWPEGHVNVILCKTLREV